VKLCSTWVKARPRERDSAVYLSSKRRLRRSPSRRSLGRRRAVHQRPSSSAEFRGATRCCADGRPCCSAAAGVWRRCCCCPRPAPRGARETLTSLWPHKDSLCAARASTCHLVKRWSELCPHSLSHARCHFWDRLKADIWHFRYLVCPL